MKHDETLKYCQKSIFWECFVCFRALLRAQLLKHETGEISQTSWRTQTNFCVPGSFLHRAYGWNLTVNERLEFLNLWWGAFPYNFGFVHFSLSDQVRDDLHERPVDHHRVDHQAADRVQVHRRRHVGRLQSHAWWESFNILRIWILSKLLGNQAPGTF